MKLGIVTVYNAYNCGSYLQAFALYTLLKKNNNVSFVCNSRVSKQHRFYYIFLQFIKYILKGKVRKAAFLLRRYFAFRKHQSKLHITKDCKDIDLFIYGSDTIWNIANPYFEKEWKKYWGYGITQKKITYAASAGETQEDMILKRPELRKCIAEFSGLGIRDEHTYNIVKKMLPDREIKRVIDPTLLLTSEEYKNLTKKCKEKDFILIYAFPDMRKEAMMHIRKFAQEKGKKIIAFGDVFLADKNLPFDPLIMLSYYEKADYIVTNTFHGTAFSLIYNKKFISYGKRKNKVALLLEEFGLSGQVIDESEEISSVIDNEIDYERVNTLISEKRKGSLDYLEEFIK